MNPEVGIVLSDTARQLLNDIFVWIGFGTVVGQMAKGIMPGRDPGGAVATILMGIGGCVIGCGLVSYFGGGARVTPISPLGMLVAIAGAFILLFFYRMLSGHFFTEGDYVTHRRRRSRRRRRYDSAMYED